MTFEDRKPRLLDLFCGGGGCSVGYSRAGFAVYGIDNRPQKHYPFPFLQMDTMEAMDKLLRGEGLTFSNGETLYLKDFDAYHASPPCQFGSVMRLGRWQDRQHPNHIPAIRQRLQDTGKPFVIENVEGSRKHLITPVKLCGTMLGIETMQGNQLRRHRYFECAGFWLLVPPCNHNKASAIGVYGGGQHPARRSRLQKMELSNMDFGIKTRSQVMGIDWMVGLELNEAIPPAYTTYIGKYLMQVVAQAHLDHDREG